nr:hypothetical protein [Listeria monocytogenes]
MKNQFDRHRRLRKTKTMRDLVRETVLHTDDLIYPIFVKDGKEPKTEVASMPGVFQYPLHELEEEMRVVESLVLKRLFYLVFLPRKTQLARKLITTTELFKKLQGL